ncbi:hypothetical protein ACVQ8P_08395 [Dellaglioa sp. BT-FLS60]
MDRAMQNYYKNIFTLLKTQFSTKIEKEIQKHTFYLIKNTNYSIGLLKTIYDTLSENDNKYSFKINNILKELAATDFKNLSLNNEFSSSIINSDGIIIINSDVKFDK